MRVLLTESAPGAAAESETRLREAGYDISFCHADHLVDEDGCVVLRGIGQCPLRTDADIGVVVDVRSADAPTSPTAHEFGACCALCHVPLVVTGPADTERFPWSDAAAICPSDELVGVCERLTEPVDDLLHQDAERVAREAPRANGCGVDIDVTVTHAADSAAVFVRALRHGRNGPGSRPPRSEPHAGGNGSWLRILNAIWTIWMTSGPTSTPRSHEAAPPPSS
ncbi:hypothetical protein [Catenulispora rubra]|uniref:hypothetical protein n=1 Tax=Catenulispora rubra TaxID=280293 RepID=UPI0018924618|nr:hypothetical protein [Catenulispora rubra]